MEIFEINSRAKKSAAIQKAVRILQTGGVVAHPTETVFGLAADFENEEAVKKIHKIKKTKPSKPLLINLGSKEWLSTLTVVEPATKEILKKFWPGPLALILRTKAGKKQGFRYSSHHLALSLTRSFGAPLISTSANLAGKRPAKSAQAIWQIFKGLEDKPDLILTDNTTGSGKPSVILDLTAQKPILIRGTLPKGLRLKNLIKRS